MHHHLFTIHAFCFFLTGNLVTAKCSTKAIFIQPPGEVPETAVLCVNKEFIDLKLPKRHLSDPIDLDSGKTVIFVIPQRPSGPDIPLGAPQFTIPETWTSCILLFFYDAENKLFPARIIPVNTSSADFPMGNTLIYNLSTAAVSAKLGTEFVRVFPGKSAVVKPPRSGSGDYPVDIDCAFPGDKQPTALSRSSWHHEANARQFLFIVPQAESKVPRVWGVLDHNESNAY
jgi:hypothetical protein